MRHYWLFGVLGLLPVLANAAEPLMLSNKNNNLSISIYNQNLSFVKDVRPADLSGGINEVIFDGVAQRIQPETAIIFGDGIKVMEQNYNYHLLSYQNFVEQSIGQEVTTVRTNPENGENIYEKAVLIGSADGKPILRFSYGIDTNFGGRVVFNKIPAGMSNKPTLAAKINVAGGGNKNLHLAYLTDGLSWKTDYVVNVNSGDKLNLTGWVTITNNSGIDYENAKIQLLAGDVNVVRSFGAPMMKGRMLMAANAMGMDNMAESIEPETVNSYELYTLPTTATVKDHQTKQIALIEKADVSYKKEFNMQTPLYFNGQGDEFEKRHPAITYVIENTANSNLGISLPAGIMRFYEKDKGGNLQFIGSAHIANTAKEDTLRLKLGDAFNISVSGKNKKIKEEELSRKKVTNHAGRDCYDIKERRTYQVEITVNNAENTDNTVILTQQFNDEYKIVEENIKSAEKNASERQWKVDAAKNSKTPLNYTVELTKTFGSCD